MKRIISILGIVILLAASLTACNAVSYSKRTYNALVFGYSDAVQSADYELEYEFADREKYQSLEPANQIEVHVGEQSYTAINPTKVYTQNNYYPEFQYESGDNITFTVDDQGLLTYAFWFGHTMDSPTCSQEECLQIATDFMDEIINVSDYSVSISNEDEAYYTVEFIKYIGDFRTNDSATVKVYKDGKLFSYSSSMLGRIPTDTVISDINLVEVTNVATNKLDQIFIKAKNVYDRVEYGKPIIRLTVLEDGSAALIYVVEVTCIANISSGYYASTCERISMVVTMS